MVAPFVPGELGPREEGGRKTRLEHRVLSLSVREGRTSIAARYAACVAVAQHAAEESGEERFGNGGEIPGGGRLQQLASRARQA